MLRALYHTPVYMHFGPGSIDDELKLDLLFYFFDADVTFHMI